MTSNPKTSSSSPPSGSNAPNPADAPPPSKPLCTCPPMVGRELHRDSAFTGLASNVEWAFDPEPSPNHAHNP